MRSTILPENCELVAGNLDLPWSLAFSDGQLFFTERNGNLNVLSKEVELVHHFDVVSKKGDEGGLLGLAFLPESNEQLIYLYSTYYENGKIWNKVSCFKYSAEGFIEEKIIIDKIPGGRVHNGGRIKFGPDGKLYVTTGEIWNRPLAQDLSSLGGKILRLNPDGSIPTDNPFHESPIYSYGNRNPQGLAWHPITKELFASEHGPSRENLVWYAHDEINIIRPGKNYGWPNVIGVAKDPRYIDPILSTGNETWAPSGICFYTGKKYPGYENALFVANLRGEDLRVIKLAPPEYNVVESSHSLFMEKFGRIRDIVQGPDDYLYLCTSNRDGRGRPFPQDDLIVKITKIDY